MAGCQIDLDAGLAIHTRPRVHLTQATSAQVDATYQSTDKDFGHLLYRSADHHHSALQYRLFRAALSLLDFVPCKLVFP